MTHQQSCDTLLSRWHCTQKPMLNRCIRTRGPSPARCRGTAAVHLPPDMGLVIEIDEIRQVVHPDPFHRFAAVIVPAQFPDFRMGDDDPFVAEHAGFQRRHAGAAGCWRPGMAHEATDLLVARVHAVAERDRLRRADPVRIVEIVEPRPSATINNATAAAVQRGHRCRPARPVRLDGLLVRRDHSRAPASCRIGRERARAEPVRLPIPAPRRTRRTMRDIRRAQAGGRAQGRRHQPPAFHP